MSAPTQTVGDLVGRDAELEELRSGLRDAAGGSGRLVMLSGEPGIGKTRLAEAVCVQAEAAGFRALWGRCWESGGAPAYWPWIQIVRALAAPEAESLDAADPGNQLARLVMDPGQLKPSDSEEGRFVLFDATAALLKRSAESRPLLLVLDDLHAADEPSLVLLRFVTRELSNARVLLLGTQRDVEARLVPSIGELLGALTREGRELPLHGLLSDDVRRLVELRVSVRPAEQLVGAIHRATGGNPFFVNEVVRLLAAQGALSGEGRAPARIPIPETVRGAVRQRLAALPQDGRRVLAVAAVLGREFSLAPLASVTELPTERLVTLLEDAVTRGMLTEARDALGRYAFAHALVWETLYDELSTADRIALHRRVGAALEDLYTADPEPHLAELAHHFFEAARGGDTAAAVDYSARAGDRAARLFAHEEAVANYERALAALASAPKPDLQRRLELLIALGRALALSGERDRARELVREAAQLARRLGSPEWQARAALAYGARVAWYSFVPGADRALVDLLEDALEALGPGDSELSVHVLARLAVERFYDNQPQAGAELSAAAIAMADRVGDPAARLTALYSRQWTLADPDALPDLLESSTEIVERARELGDEEMEFRGRNFRLRTLLQLGEIEAVDAEIRACERLARELRLPLYRWQTGVLRAMRAITDGRIDEGERLALEALALAQQAQIDEAGIVFAPQAFGLRWTQGRLAEIEPAFRALHEAHPEQVASRRAAFALMLSELDRGHEARPQFDALAAGDFEDIPRNGMWAMNMFMASLACGYFGDRRRATKLYERFAPYESMVVVTGAGASCAGSAALALGVLAGTLGRYDDAERHFERAVACNRRLGFLPMTVRALAEHASMLAARGTEADLDRAGEIAAEAVALSDQLGLAGIGEWAQRAMRRVDATIRPRGPRADGRHAYVLRREGDHWAVGRPGAVFRIRDVKGLGYLSLLIGRPGSEFYALDLAMGDRDGETDAKAADVRLSAGGLGDAGELLDATARSAYRRRLDELRDDVEEADMFGDPERAARAREEIDALSGELARAVGLGGRNRRAAAPAERARISVTKAIRSAIRRIAAHDPELGAHLDRAVRTGMFCAYLPEPGTPVRWTQAA